MLVTLKKKKKKHSPNPLKAYSLRLSSAFWILHNASEIIKQEIGQNIAGYLKMILGLLLWFKHWVPS